MRKEIKKLCMYILLCMCFCVRPVSAEEAVKKEEAPSSDVIVANMQKAMTDIKVIGLEVTVAGENVLTAVSDQNTKISKVIMTEGKEQTVTWVDQNAGKSYKYNAKIGKYEFEPTDEKESEAKQTADEAVKTTENLKFDYDGMDDLDGKKYYKLKGAYKDKDVTYDYIIYVDPESYKMKSVSVTMPGVIPMTITAQFSYPESLTLPPEVPTNAILMSDYKVSGKQYKNVTYTVKHIKGKAVFYGESTTQYKGRLEILDSITVCGEQYPVYGIADGAFMGKTQINSAVIGKNVEVIGKSAFYGCSKLKKVTVKSTTISKVGKKAFYGNAKKLTIKVPKKKLKKYKSMFKKSKLGSGAKVTK